MILQARLSPEPSGKNYIALLQYGRICVIGKGFVEAVRIDEEDFFSFLVDDAVLDEFDSLGHFQISEFYAEKRYFRVEG